MTVKLIVLFFAPLMAGLLIYLVPKGRNANYKLLLVFAGSYLFAITVSHILPELYQHDEVRFTGIFVLAGFFLQQVLEYFTSGVEHGHLHGHGVVHHHHHHDHHHEHEHPSHSLSAFVLLAALCIHAFLEGAMLAQPSSGNDVYNVNAVLLGIVLHRAPAAFALMTVLVFQLGSTKKALPYLLGFSLAAPLGLLLSNYLSASEVLTRNGLIYLYALVCGNFLQISTTIVFESSPEHRFNAQKLLVAGAGAVAAVVLEMAI
ncbi:MAG: ZIP family metal transporter [Cyclobacteriaceae bacterium]|jgi:zinc transporter ZupT|nr:ZIP family metal transporter [Cyclobacteriaceae bacterium]